MKRVFFVVILLAGLSVSAVSLAAADLPVVRQPNDPAFSASDRAALTAACAAIEDLLRPDFSLARLVHLRGLSWGDADYAQFTAGWLRSAGYTVQLATGSGDAGAGRTWVLVGISVSVGMTYIPVEASPAMLSSSSRIGQIAWQGGIANTAFSASYLAFAQAAELGPNSPPAVNLTLAERYAIVDDTTTFMVTGSDPDGGVLAYLWTISDGTEIVETRATFWYTFRKTGDTVLTVMVVDTRGAYTTLSLEVDVLAERPDCGCGDSMG